MTVFDDVVKEDGLELFGKGDLNNSIGSESELELKL